MTNTCDANALPDPLRMEREKWDAFYEAHPEEPENPTIRAFCEELAAHMAALLPDGARILDAGCGGGWQSLALARLGRFEVHLMDFSAPALRSARRRFERAGQKAEFHLDDVFRKDQPQYDLVFNAGVLEHYTLEQQAAFLTGMANRSRGYVLALTPNNLCYWYWIWRIKAAAQGNWPYGSEVPVSDFSRAFRAAGLRFLGGAFLGEEWTETNIRAIADLPESVREELVTIHRSPVLLPEHKAYLYAGLGAVSPALGLPAGSVFRSGSSPARADAPRQQAMFADLLAMQIANRSTQREMLLQVEETAKERAALLERLRAEEQSLAASRAAESAGRTEIQQLQAKLAEMEHALAASSAEASASRAQAQQLQIKLDEAEHALAASRAAESAGRTEIQQLQAKLAETEHALAASEGIVSALREESAASAERMQALASERDRSLTAIREELSAERAEAQRLFDELDRIYRSRGWVLLRLLYGMRAKFRPRAILSDAKALGKPPFKMMQASLQKARSLARDPVRAWRERSADSFLSRSEKKDVVALVVAEFDKGGLEEVVLTLAENLQREEHTGVVVFVVGDVIGHLGETARQRGIEVVALNGNPLLLRQMLRAFNVRLVNLHYTIFGITEYRRANIPIVYTIHNTYIWADAAFVRERAEAYRHVSRFIAVSEPVREFFASRFQMDPRNVMTIPNGLDFVHLARETPVSRAALGMARDDIFFLNVASFNWHKFHVLMVAAMERLVPRLPNARLLFVGNTQDPACRAHIESEILRRGLDKHIRILDYVPKEQVIGLMKQADCFLLPSLIEGWSIAVMEAMCCGLPLILSDVGSARTVIQEEDIGIIIRNPYARLADVNTELILNRYRDDSHLDNLGDLVAAMERIGRNGGEWKRKGKAGQEKIAGIFNASRMRQSYVSCFHDLIAAEQAHAD